MRSSIAESFAPSEFKNKQINCFSDSNQGPSVINKIINSLKFFKCKFKKQGEKIRETNVVQDSDRVSKILLQSFIRI